MKRWSFLIVLLTCLQAGYAGNFSEGVHPVTGLSDSLDAIFTSAPAETQNNELSAESFGQPVAAPDNTLIDSISVPAAIPTDLIPKTIAPDKIKKRKRIVAALLAFPFPFGIIGLHRIYLGSKPYIPLIYIGTLGGGVGIIPFIDFIVICLEKDITRYCNNPNLIMWAK
ncbi:MAG: hypothetical protein K0S33_482 [Bacteroidetes bacterium]|jgi:TM2 domain-containing membrane protein YozV|nr:hypothetical protein [Bacteroidota bacterium]